MKTVKLLLALSLIILGSSAALKAQDRPQHELHSMMIYNFIKYIQWPDEHNAGDFVIGVIGDDKVYETLSQWYGNKARGDKNLMIKKFSSVAEVTGCQLLYIGADATNQFDQVNAQVQNKPTLTVTGKNGLGHKGSCINFKIVDNRLKFELNQAAVERSKLKISSQLTAMAILI